MAEEYGMSSAAIISSSCCLRKTSVSSSDMDSSALEVVKLWDPRNIYMKEKCTPSLIWLIKQKTSISSFEKLQDKFKHLVFSTHLFIWVVLAYELCFWLNSTTSREEKKSRSVLTFPPFILTLFQSSSDKAREISMGIEGIVGHLTFF